MALVRLLGGACALRLTLALAENSFETFEKRFQKQYRSEDERTARKSIFSANLLLSQKLTSEEAGGAGYKQTLVTFSAADSPYGDMTQEEFTSQILLPPHAPPPQMSSVGGLLQNHDGDTPSAWDWRDHGAVTKVKDQGSLGTCWAFSTMANLEGQRFLKLNVLEDLSVEQLVECDNTDDVQDSIADCGMFGGWPKLAYTNLMKSGIRLDSDFPYCSGITSIQCYPCMASNYSKTDCGDHGDMYCNKTSTKGQIEGGYCLTDQDIVAHVSGWTAISSNETVISQQLVANGPLSVLLNAATLQFYKHGVWNPKKCDPTELDHAVLLVGFGEDEGSDYWTIKNSWGQKWGESGYFRIARGVGKCGVNTAVSTGFVEK